MTIEMCHSICRYDGYPDAVKVSKLWIFPSGGEIHVKGEIRVDNEG